MINDHKKEQNIINSLIFVILITIGSMFLLEIVAPDLNSLLIDETMQMGD